MTIDQLIKRLHEFRELHGGQITVRMMTQKHWPLEYEIAGICSHEDIDDFADISDPDKGYSPNCQEAIYIIEGTQLGYGNKLAWEVVK